MKSVLGAIRAPFLSNLAQLVWMAAAVLSLWMVVRNLTSPDFSQPSYSQMWDSLKIQGTVLFALITLWHLGRWVWNVGGHGSDGNVNAIRAIGLFVLALLVLFAVWLLLPTFVSDRTVLEKTFTDGPTFRWVGNSPESFVAASWCVRVGICTFVLMLSSALTDRLVRRPNMPEGISRLRRDRSHEHVVPDETFAG